MGEGSRQSAVHLIIAELSRAVDALGLGVPPLFVERWGVALHQALASRAREFHTHQHALDLCTGADPLETIAALYHDTVYVQVDLGVPEHFAALLAPLIEKEPGGWRVLAHAGTDPVARDVLAVFGREALDLMTPLTGLNELASAFVVAKEFEGVMSRVQLLALAAAIEGTIPFRVDQGGALERRLLALGVTPAEALTMVRRSVRLSNSDVGNFAVPDPAAFLDNTWKLLPETNPALHMASTYSVREYRVALERMEGFLSQLKAERVFRAYGGEPAPAEHLRRIEVAGANIALAVRYLRAKLYASALVEALATESGGDAPEELLMGAAPEVGLPSTRRIEQFLPPLPQPSQGDPALLELLRGERSTASSFDAAPSPLAAHLYATLGEAEVERGLAQARDWWRGDAPTRAFLQAQPRAVVREVALAAAQIAATRAGALDALLALLDGRQ
jgi:hypothetical protein